jgi:hypothetical protein
LSGTIISELKENYLLSQRLADGGAVLGDPVGHLALRMVGIPCTTASHLLETQGSGRDLESNTSDELRKL